MKLLLSALVRLNFGKFLILSVALWSPTVRFRRNFTFALMRNKFLW